MINNRRIGYVNVIKVKAYLGILDEDTVSLHVYTCNYNLADIRFHISLIYILRYINCQLEGKAGKNMRSGTMSTCLSV